MEEGVIKKREKINSRGGQEKNDERRIFFVLAGGGKSGGGYDQPRHVQANLHMGDGSRATISSGARAAIGLAKAEAAVETMTSQLLATEANCDNATGRKSRGQP